MMRRRHGNADRTSPGTRAPADWAALFDANHNAIWRYLSRRAGPTVADDLAGEVFLRALRSTAAPAEGNERAWLYGIATNVLRERSRKEIRRLRAYARVAAPGVESVDQEAAAERVDAAAMARAVAGELSGLNAVERDTFLMFALTELDYEGIAVATGVPVGTVRSRLHRTRRRLRQALGEEPFDADEARTIQTRTG